MASGAFTFAFGCGFGLAPGTRARANSGRVSSERARSRHGSVWISRAGNRLADASSPYLLQHAANPVDWYPWGEEAFVKAQKEGKLVFLSVGYATCHWCHQMERDSFENKEVAKVLNEHFVACKVDREERPDVDGIYMAFVQATSGRGGWPMNVFLTPTLVPIVGSTYIPHEKFISVCTAVAAGWTEDREKLIEDGSKVLDALRQFSALPPSDDSKLNTEAILNHAFKSALETFDTVNGGFGGAPKFPRANFLDFLLHYGSIHRGTKDGNQARNMVFTTLRNMIRGGIHDQLGGGWHRYSTDMVWHIPHFEKMLFDQSQMASALLNASGISGDPSYAQVAVQTLDYVCRELYDAEGGFFAAQDAESSLVFNGVAQMNEGAFYVFTRDQCLEIVGEAYPLVKAHFGIQRQGNAPQDSDRQGSLAGKNTLKVFKTPSELADMFEMPEDKVISTLDTAKDRLRQARARRSAPRVDDKIVTDWNGLMISTFARASRQFDRPDYLEIADKVGNFILERLSRRNQTEGKAGLLQLYRSCRHDTVSPVEGFAQDYSSMVTGAVELFCSSGKISWLRVAIDLQETLDSEFWDTESGGYFVTRKGAKHLILRRKEDQDGDEPSSSSMTALNCVRLSCITGNRKYMERAREIVCAFGAILEKFPTALPTMLCATTRINYGKARVVVCGRGQSADYKNLIKVFNEVYIPLVTLVPLRNDQNVTDDIFSPDMITKVEQSVASKTAMAFVCLESGCLKPTGDPKELRQQLLDAFGTGSK